MPMPKLPTRKKSISLNGRPVDFAVKKFVSKVTETVRLFGAAPRREDDGEFDAMEARLEGAPVCELEPNADEVANAERAMAEYRRGEFTIDPLTARDRGLTPR
jgi:hypothetical protein